MNKKPLHVCHVTMLFNPYFSGHGIYLEKVFTYLSKNNITNVVLTANYDKLKKDEMVNGVSVHRIRMKKEWKKWNLIFTLQAISYLFRKRHEIDIIHLHGLWDIYGLFTLFSKIFKKKIILHMVLLGGDDPMTIQKGYKLMHWRFKLLLSFIDSFISISSPITNRYRKTCLPIEKLFQIPQGVDIENFSPISKEEKILLRKKLNLPESKSIVTFVGAIIQRKGVDILLEAWTTINNKLKDVLLLLIGPDTFEGFDGANVTQFENYAHQMKTKVNKNRLNVIFIGKSDKIDLFLKASDIFVLPSRYEGFGSVVIEAMSCGIPVVITEMNSVANDLIKDSKQGFIVKDTKDLADKLCYLLVNDDSRVIMGKEARIRAVEVFDLRKINNRYIAVYEKILNK